MTEIAIAATIFNEARGESSAGRQAVKAVIQNREAYTCPKKGCGRNHNLAEWRNSTIFHGYATARPNVPAAEEAIWQECVNLASRSVSVRIIPKVQLTSKEVVLVLDFKVPPLLACISLLEKLLRRLDIHNFKELQ